MKTDLLDLEALIAQASQLTPLPQSTVKLAALVGSKRDNVAEVADIVTFDPALTFRLIRVANSALSGGTQPITNVRDAVGRLGTAQVFSLAVASSVQPHMQKNIPEYGFSDQDFWRHSVAAAVATEVAQPFCQVDLPSESFTAALLHDIGKLIMARFLSTEILELMHEGRKSAGLTFLEAETKILRVHHGELGGIIAQHWKFPERIVKGIIFHHEPDAGDDPICDMVYMANLIAKQAIAPADQQADLTFNPGSVQRLGSSKENIESWIDAARQRFDQVRTRYNVK